MITDIFKLISKLKDFNKQELYISNDDENIMKIYFKLYKVKKLVPYYVWRKAVINTSLDECISLHASCELIVKRIINYNGK